MNIHNAISIDAVRELNTEFSNSSFTADEKKQVAAMTGKSYSTVRRWFDGGTTQINALPLRLAQEKTLFAVVRDTNHIHSNRTLLLAMMSAEGVQGSRFSGTEKVQRGTASTLTDLFSILRDIISSKYASNALISFTYVKDADGIYIYTFVYRTPVGTESEWLIRSDTGTDDDGLAEGTELD